MSETNCFEAFTKNYKNYKNIQALVAGLKETEDPEHNEVLAKMIVEIATSTVDSIQALHPHLKEMAELCSTSEIGLQVSQILVSYVERLLMLMLELSSTSPGSSYFYCVVEKFKKLRFDF